MLRTIASSHCDRPVANVRVALVYRHLPTTFHITFRRVGTVTVIGIFSFFCAVIRISATMAPFLNDIRVHGCFVFHLVPQLPARSDLFSVMVAVNSMSKERRFLKVRFKRLTF